MDKDQTIIGWISDSGVRWGVDAKHRVAEALRETDLNTWQFGLDRLLMGYALPPGGGQLVGDLMYTMHFYAASHKQFLRDRGHYASGKGIQIFVSKSGGMQATGDGPLDNAEWQRWIDWMQARQISWLTWSVADKNEICSMLLPRASSNGGWSEADLKESGRLTREHISQNSPGKRKNSNCLDHRPDHQRQPRTMAGNVVAEM